MSEYTPPGDVREQAHAQFMSERMKRLKNIGTMVAIGGSVVAADAMSKFFFGISPAETALSYVNLQSVADHLAHVPAVIRDVAGPGIITLGSYLKHRASQH